MALSTEIISQFAKIVTPKPQRPESMTVTGTAKLYDGKIYVQIDGSNGQLTPIASSTVGMKDGDRVTVQIKNHSANVTGNATDPSAGKSYADDINNKVDNAVDQIAEFEIVIADKVDVDQLNAVNGRIDNLVSENVTITGKLDAVEADIVNLEADNVTINEKLTTAEADIDHLESSKADITVLESEYATIENLEATNANIHDLEVDYGNFKDLAADNFTAINGSITNLETNKLNVEDAKIMYANIDFANIGDAAIENFFSKSGMIEDLVVGSGTITGHLVGVTISGDLIEGNTIKADKLVVLGEDGLYYKLNVNAETVGAQQTEYNSINGSIITANTITAEKINVNDLVAFDATIGGFKIGSDSIYSGVKSSVDNSTAGVYMDNTGQFALGDTNNYLKYFKDADGNWTLDISAQSLKISTSDKTIEETISDMQEQIDNVDVSGVEVGARNLLLRSNTAASNASNPLKTWTLTVSPDASEQYTFSAKATLDPTYQNYKLYTESTLLADLSQDNELFKGTFVWPEIAYNTLSDFSDTSKTEMQMSYTASTQILSANISGSISPSSSMYLTDSINFVNDGRTYTLGYDVIGDLPEDLNFAVCADFGATGIFTIGNKPFDLNTYTFSDAGSETRSTTFIADSDVLNIVIFLFVESSAAATLNLKLSLTPTVPVSLHAYTTSSTASSAGNIVEWAKLERGTINTDWSPAPEDTETDMGQLESSITSTVTRVNTLEQNMNGWEFNFAEISKEISDINGQLTVDSISSKIKYIRFENGTIIIGIEGNDLELHISNDRVSFLDKGVEVAYISNQQLYITNAEVENQLRIGKFQFVPRSNGNLTLKYVG